MITGFNTDIEFDGVVYHVQTEDKGTATPIILSLVYDRGTILASKRVPYEDLLEGDFDERILAERLQKQHSLICAAVRKGRISDLKKMSAAGAQTAEVAALFVSETYEPAEPIYEQALSGASQPEFEDIANVDADGMDSVIDEVTIFEDEEIPAAAVQIISHLAGKSRPESTAMTVEIIGESAFRGGEDRSVCILVCKGSARIVVGDAEVMVKVLGSAFRPLIFHARTDKNGIARVRIQLPHFQNGRATMLVRAASGGEEVELRRVVLHG